MTTPHTHSPTLLKPAKPVGIVGINPSLSSWKSALSRLAHQPAGLPRAEAGLPWHRPPGQV